MAEIAFHGCAPVPLAAYLKALGIFRLVAEQKDRQARGFWRNETFVLDTALTHDELACFFLEEYRPSPIISPWNGGSGFYFREGKSQEKDPKTGKKIKTGKRDEPTAATRIVDRFAATRSNDRLALYGRVIAQTRDVLRELGLVQAPTDDGKRDLVSVLRAQLADECLPWLDAAVALAGETLGFPPLLGSGGNDGNLDFSSNFMQRVADVIDPETGRSTAGAQASLESALFGSATTTIGRGAIGQFAPGAAGGPNATTGFERSTLINAWDYILALEGALLFASSVTRRIGTVDVGALSYPFTVRTTGAGGAGAAGADEGDARGEVWLPLWAGPASATEILSLLSEGRATVGRKSAQDGLGFARAVAALGVNRGVTAFQRVGFFQRSGNNYIAAPMGRIRVQRNSRADLLNDLDRGTWLKSFRRYARGKNAPARLRSLALRFDEAIFALTQDAAPQAVQRVLIAIGETAAYLASSPKARDPKEGNQRPPPRLSRAWFEAANDDSAEFRIAAALAGLGRGPKREDEIDGDESPHEITEAGEAEDESQDTAGQVTLAPDETGGGRFPPPFRAHLAPLDEKSWYSQFRRWSDGAKLTVWSAGALDRNLIAILERRHLFAAQCNPEGGPFAARSPADLASVLTFLACDTDDAKITALAQGLAWAEPPYSIKAKRLLQQSHMPFAYALLKPFFASIEDVRSVENIPKDICLPVPPGLMARLRAGDLGAAVEIACRRARASGLPVTFEPRRAEMMRFGSPRLLASLLIPIRPGDLKRVVERAYPALFEEKMPFPEEDPINAA